MRVSFYGGVIAFLFAAMEPAQSVGLVETDAEAYPTGFDLAQADVYTDLATETDVDADAMKKKVVAIKAKRKVGAKKNAKVRSENKKMKKKLSNIRKKKQSERKKVQNKAKSNQKRQNLSFRKKACESEEARLGMDAKQAKDRVCGAKGSAANAANAAKGGPCGGGSCGGPDGGKTSVNGAID